MNQRLRFRILERDDFRCRYCGLVAEETELEVDHVHPVALGGTDHADNLVTACRRCNCGKSSRPLDMLSSDEMRILELANEALDARLARAPNKMPDGCVAGMLELARLFQPRGTESRSAYDGF